MKLKEYEKEIAEDKQIDSISYRICEVEGKENEIAEYEKMNKQMD